MRCKQAAPSTSASSSGRCAAHLERVPQLDAGQRQPSVLPALQTQDVQAAPGQLLGRIHAHRQRPKAGLVPGVRARDAGTRGLRAGGARGGGGGGEGARVIVRPRRNFLRRRPRRCSSTGLATNTWASSARRCLEASSPLAKQEQERWQPSRVGTPLCSDHRVVSKFRQPHCGQALEGQQQPCAPPATD